MSLVPLAAELVRRAASDEGYALDLERAIENRTARRGLIRAPIEPQELRALSPGDWLWFMLWRQNRGAALDDVVLTHLTSLGTSRAFRFELRGLVMRDAKTEAELKNETDRSVGLSWLAAQALEAPNPLEVVQDALQYATEPAWFTIRSAVSSVGERGAPVRGMLRAFALERELDARIPSAWGLEWQDG